MRHLHWVPVTLLACAAISPARAGLSEYQTARAKNPPRTDIALATVKANPAAYRHIVLELRGQATGVSRADAEISVLLRFADGTTALTLGSDAISPPTSGEFVRALARVEASGAIRLIALVTETEIGDRSLDPKPESTRPAAKSRMPVRWPVAQHGRSSVSSRQAPVDPRITALYQQVVQSFNPRLTEAQASLIASSIVQSSYNRGVDARFIMAVFAAESGFKITAKSRAGAMGIGQLMPGTARGLGVKNAYDPKENIEGAVRLIQQHWITYSARTDDFGKFISLVCAAYNAGPGAVKKYGGVPPYRETQNYIRKVSEWYSVFAPELFVK